MAFFKFSVFEKLFFDVMVPDKQVVAFYFRVRQRLLSVAVVEFVESELVSVGYFDLFLSKNIFCFDGSILSRILFLRILIKCLP